MDFESYLDKHHTLGTKSRYLREVNQFSKSITNIDDATYSDIVGYIGAMRNRVENVAPTLYAIRKYFDYLIHTKKRKDNPAKSIQLRDKQSRDIQFQDLFSKDELQQLLSIEERYSILKNRNKAIVSLLIYQGLTNADIRNLELENINLEKGTIYIKAERKTNNRKLDLHADQTYWLMKYIKDDRPKMFRLQTNKLFISKLGKEENGEGIGYLIERCKHLFPDRKLNPKTIRQSVIANRLKDGNDIRLVQKFAGHKYASTTERYLQNNLDALQNEIDLHHPLNNIV